MRPGEEAGRLQVRGRARRMHLDDGALVCLLLALRRDGRRSEFHLTGVEGVHHRCTTICPAREAELSTSVL
jgi:hypothetical protein